MPEMAMLLLMSHITLFFVTFADSSSFSVFI
jgi:hypothetical protein